MKQTKGKLTSRLLMLAMLVLVVIMAVQMFAGNGGQAEEKLPDSFDETQVREEAEKVIGYFNDRDYQSIIDMGDKDLKANSTAESFAKTGDPILEEKGAFKEIGEAKIVGKTDEKTGKSYGGAIITVTYENGEMEFTVAFNEDMEIAQFLVR